MGIINGCIDCYKWGEDCKLGIVTGFDGEIDVMKDLPPNCPLPDSDAWKVELLGWIEDIINERYSLIDPRDVRQKIKEM